jgi:phosphoglycerate dehydrogenase-like enzyme
LPRIVWVPPAHIGELGELPQGFEARPIPADPLSDPDIGAVEIVVVRFRDDLDPLYPALSALRVVQTVGAGVDHHVKSVPPHVTLCSAKGTHDTDVAEYVLAAVLGAQRQLTFFRDEQLAGRWTPRPSIRLAGSVVMILGYGSIGAAVEERLACFGVRIVRVARTAREGVAAVDALPDLIGEADVVIVLTALTEETYHLLDGPMLARMHDGALLVNAARGGIVDADALLAEVRADRLRAVIDATDPEPLPEGHPMYSAPNLLLTPHSAGGTVHALADVYALITAQIWRYAAGDPLHNVVTGGY